LVGSNQDGVSFTGGNLQVGGSAFLDDVFRTSGTVVLLGARIAGRLRMTSAQLTDRIQNGMSLAGDYLQVGGNALLDEDFTANGAVYLVGAHVTGSPLLTSAKLGERNGISLADDNPQVRCGCSVGEPDVVEAAEQVLPHVLVVVAVAAGREGGAAVG
jgi:hypothetical protein